MYVMTYLHVSIYVNIFVWINLDMQIRRGMFTMSLRFINLSEFAMKKEVVKMNLIRFHVCAPKYVADLPASPKTNTMNTFFFRYRFGRLIRLFSFGFLWNITACCFPAPAPRAEEELRGALRNGAPSEGSVDPFEDKVGKRGRMGGV